MGRPYQIAGKWYTPQENPDYDRQGTASWYGPRFHGRRTANGEMFDRDRLTAAHPTLPLPSYVRVTNLANDRSVMVRVNDRGPFSRARLIDVSERTAELLGFKPNGMAPVRVQYIEKARIAPKQEEEFLMASFRAPEGEGRKTAATLLASAAPMRRAARPAREAAVQIAAGAPATRVAVSRRWKRPRLPVAPGALALGDARPAEDRTGMAAAVGALTSAQPADDRISMAFDLISEAPD